MEAFALIGIISSTIQLVDFSCKVLARIKECRDNSQRLPEVFWSLQNQLPLISHSLKITLNQTESHEFNDHACKALLTVINTCRDEITRLQEKLEKLAPSKRDSAWAKNFKALTSVFHDKEITSISANLSQSLAVINQYHGAYTAATTGTILRKLTAAVNAIPEEEHSQLNSIARHFMVPTILTDDFTGRGEAVDRLGNYMSSHSKHRRAAIVGLGCMGKPRLMLQYAYRFRDSKTHSVFWMHASSLSRVNKTCLEIAKKAKIPGWEDPKSDKIDLVTKWLENPQSGKWLLLVDNADDFDLLFGSRHLVISLPRSDEGAIIMTTRDARVGMEFAKKQVISIGALTQSESISLLANRLEKDESADEDIKKLSQELCGIPLALVQASSFIQQNYLPIPDYLDLYRYSDSEKVALLSEDFEDDIRDPESLNPIATTWSVSFDFIQKQNPLAAETLSVMSMLDPQAIPVSLIEFGKSRVAFSKAMGILQAFALITMRSDGPMCEGHREKSFYLHQLVRLAMRSWLNIQNRLESFTARALSTMAERFTDCQWETRAKWSSYLPHAAVLFDSDYLAGLEGLVTHVLHDHESGTLSHTPEGKICPVCAANLLTTLSTCHYITGKPTISFQEAEKAYRLRRKFLGENHMTTLDSLDLIARPAKDLYLFSKAVEVCQLAMMRKSETLGPDHPSTLRSMAYLGITLRLMERLQEAREIGCTVLERRRKILGDDHPDTLISMAHVGQLLTL